MRTTDKDSEKFIDIELFDDGSGLIEVYEFEPDYPIFSLNIEDMKTFVSNLQKLDKITND